MDLLEEIAAELPNAACIARRLVQRKWLVKSIHLAISPLNGYQIEAHYPANLFAVDKSQLIINASSYVNNEGEITWEYLTPQIERVENEWKERHNEGAHRASYFVPDSHYHHGRGDMG